MSKLKALIRLIHSDKFYSAALSTLLLVILLFSAADPVASKRSLPVQFGSDISLNVLPTEFVSDGWGGVRHVFVQDLTNDALYQEFSARNAAYLSKSNAPDKNISTPNLNNRPRPVNNNAVEVEQQANFSGVPVDTDASATATTPTNDLIRNATVTNETADEKILDKQVPVVEEVSETGEPQPVVDEEPNNDSSVENSTSDAGVGVSLFNLDIFTVSNLSTALYPLLVESTTTPVSDIALPPAPSDASELSAEIEEVSIDTKSNSEITTEEMVDPTGTNSVPATEPAFLIEDSMVAKTATSSDDAASIGEVVSSTTVDFDTVEPAQDSGPDITDERSDYQVVTSSELTLSNFDMPALEPGQFMTGAQLRVSIGATLVKNATGTLPSLEVLFGTATSLSPVGIILIDGEVSNAINGGYYLFALPEMSEVAALESAQITFKFNGDQDMVEGLYIDAAWLEVQTKQVTESDITARGTADNLKHLKKPETTTFVSEKTNFDRGEAPLFHLRYNSQRNALVRGVRNFFGADAVSLETVEVRHRSFGLLGVQPEVKVTPEGLLTIEIPEDQLKNMRPGEYEMALELTEGNRTFTETFNFQWGILSINPNKSEYEIGEVVDLSIGALTPNGHTICEANLDLYIINPLEQVSRLAVSESGFCDGNNVTDVPDFLAESLAIEPGEHTLYLERLSDDGDVLSFVYDSFLVTPDQRISIERVGPTRIYPPAPYPMVLTVAAKDTFLGTLTERVPRDFAISSTSAEVTIEGDWQVLRWDMSIRAGEVESVSYQFDAPDISPYLYELGPASLQGNPTTRTIEVASTTASTTELQTITEGGTLFTEHRQWKIASDAVGNMLLLWDASLPLPGTWTCVSCTSGDPFFGRMIMGSSTYSVTGGTATNTHSVTTSLLASSDATVEGGGTGGPAIVTHTHTLTPTIEPISNFPEYRTLQVIRFNGAAGEQTIPQGAIALFDVASSSLPANWNRYAAHDGKYIFGANTVGATGGSNEHAHTVSGSTGGSTGGTARSRGGGTQTTGAADGHTHTISTTTDTVNKEPPFVEFLLAQASADITTLDNGIIAMWDADVDDGWVDISSDPSATLSNRFVKASTAYGATGGSETHSHVDITGAQTSVPSATTNGRTGSTGSGPTHTHIVNFTDFTTESNIPPFATVVFGKRQGTNPVYEQLSSRWYANEDAQTPTDPWPDDADQILDLTEREPITATSTPVKNGDVVRLRINAAVSNATSSAGSSFKLQYAAAAVCSTASGWADVGDTSSSTLWRGAVNGSVSNESTLSSTLLASTTDAQSYEESGFASSSPNEMSVGDVGEWDFVLEHNNASAGTNYCFRMVQGDGTQFSTYSHYPQLFTNEAPAVETLDDLFDNEKTASTTPILTFAAVDVEGQKVHYELEVDTDTVFSSPVISRDTVDDAAQFENQVLISDKAPFRQGELIAFTPVTTLVNGTTYYWRVRAIDPEGSNEYGAWSTVRSFTIDTTLSASAWYQTETEQFDTNTLVGIDTSGNSVSLAAGSTTGSVVSTPIEFGEGALGTAWASLVVSETDASDVLDYQIEYLDDTDTWTLIPDGDLPGNSTGLGTTTNLLNLDVATYGTIRLVANFTANTGSPSFSNWTVNWGFRVETPTIISLFPNEQTGTTTPSFTFTTTDPQNNELTYQVQWSTTPDFAASTTRTSDVDTGFSNLDSGIDVDPFTSGDTIQLTIQPVDVLSGSTTYWWRVRARDSGVGGDDAYSFWTDAQSFTVIEGTVVSTWFQTTVEQFDTNILSGTQAVSPGNVAVATTATEAIVVYGENNESTPRYRLWNGSTLGTEANLLDIGAPLKWTVVQAGTTREEYVAATLGTDADINVQVFSTGSWGNLTELTTAVSNINARGFDVVYESLSGDAMVVYCDGDANPSYTTWNGSTWATSTGITVTETTDCDWIQLASDPTSNEIIMLMRGADGNPYEAQVWNGTTWGNATTLGRITETNFEGMAVEYEESGGQALIVASDGNPARFTWNSWNGTTWAGAANQALGDDFEWGSLVRDIGSDEMALCLVDDTNDIAVVRWSGTAWTLDDNLEVDSTKNEPGFACVYENTTGRDNYILLTYSDAATTNYQTYNTTTWSAETQVNSIVNTATQQLIRTGVADILGVFFDNINDTLRFSTWDGTSWSATSDIETNASVNTSPYGQPFFMAPRNANTEGTTIVSPGVDFDDGLGPYWQSFSWNDSQPPSSEIRYYVQYQSATGTWAFIPAGDLPDNDIGTTTGPFDLSALNTNTYNVIRPYAELTCDGSGNCPTLQDWKIEWAGGITVSGSIAEYDQTTAVNSGTVSVAVNGEVQTGKTGTISSGQWSISNVTTFPGDIVTVYISGDASDATEAVGVARYDGQGDMTGISLFQRHLTLGSDDATTTPLTNSDIGLYDATNNPSDIFFDVTGTTLETCATAGCADVELFIATTTIYEPGGKIVTHDIENNGTFTPGSNTIEINGSWDNNATTTMIGSTVVFAATSTTESIDSVGSQTIFNNVTFGTTTGSGAWTLANPLDVDGDLTVTRGTLARGATAITVAGDVRTEVTGEWSGIGTTTFDGAVAAIWSDTTASGANIGNVVIDGAAKVVSMASDVQAQSVTIGANDTLDASVSNYTITVLSDWENQNNFLARSGTVVFAATSTGQDITTAGDAFYNLTFNGANGGWSFTDTPLLINNDLTIATGTVTLPNTATTTIAGSFDATGGAFQNNNGTLLFTANTAETIVFDGGDFTNVAYNIAFNGGGSWTMLDTHATATNDVVITQGAVTFPSGTLAIGGVLNDAGGSFTGGGGLVRFYSSNPEVITVGGSSFDSVVFDGVGSWSFADTTVDVDGDFTVTQGTVTTPTTQLTIAGSFINNDTITAATGTVEFDASTTGNTIDLGSSSLHNLTINSATGGWTIIGNATTTNDFTLQAGSNFTLQSGDVLAVGGVFTNNVGGASTTWLGTTLSLSGDAFDINNKIDAGDAYDTLVLSNGTDAKVWNSIATTAIVAAGGSLYSQDHNTVDGDLYIFGDYERASGGEYWSYDTDFDGADLAASSSERTVNVRLASDATVTVTDSVFEVVGDSIASTTIANQGAGTYTVTVSGGTTTAQYYEFTDLGTTGLTLSGATQVPTLRDGSYTVGVAAGSAITLSSTTIDANPAKQIFNVSFATTTAIDAVNVTQIDGAPASYWWFRNGSGNLYGESKDNDTGDPGSVRFDDSSLVLTISGVVYADAGITPLSGGATCDGVTQVIHVYVEGNPVPYTGSCDNVTGAYSVSGVTVIGDPTLTIYLNNAPDGEQGSVITRTPTADISNLDIYTNRVIVRNEDTEALTIANLAIRDNSDDADLQFTAATTTNPDTLTLAAGNELFVWASSTFTPGGEVTLQGEAALNGYDGTLVIDDAATFNTFSTSTLTIGGRLELGASSTLNAASSTVLMIASTTGKSITAPDTITFNALTFNGPGGSWNIGADIVVNADMTITAGTVTGTGDISLPNGNLTGDGVLSLGGGTTTIAATNTLGGNTAWTFYNLKLGDTLQVGTTTPVFTGTTTVSGVLTIESAHYLDAGSTVWDLAGVGTVFVENGTFIEDTSTVRYSGGGANVRSTQYYNLDVHAGAGSQTYTATGLGIIVDGTLTIGGDAATVFDITANDPAFDVNGDVIIRSNGTLSTSDTADFTIAGSYDNNGTLTPNGGTVTFDGAGTIAIAAGSSVFANVAILATGDVTVSEHATATALWRTVSANSFTLTSGESLAVGGTFYNGLDDADTTWTGTTLRLYGGNDYTINPATSSDSYATLDIDDTTQIRMWNSDASTYDVAATASLYSQDHAGDDGDLYIWGAYQKTSAADYWSYATDFDGTALGGSGRKVDVFMDSGASVTVTGGFLDVTGIATASTTIQNQGAGSYSLTVGGSASTSMNYYEIRDIDSAGLTLTGAPTVDSLSFGDLEVSQNGGTAMTVGGTVINENPAKNFTQNRFALNGVGSGFNVTATGTSVSSWRFTNHYGDIDGEANDVDPDGDPGYVSWDDSAALITISGTVYADDTTTVSSVCDTEEIRLVVAGVSSATTSCNASTGFYSFSNISYGPTDSVIVYINDAATVGAAVTDSPVSNISQLDIYENHVTIRHENTDPITIADMAVYDSSDDADIPFTAIDAGTDTLTLPADRKLVVWDSKTFAPGGDVIVTSGGVTSYGGSIELQPDAVWEGAGNESLTIGGSFELDTDASFIASNGTTTFTTTGAARVIDVNEGQFNNVAFTGSGSWIITDATYTTSGYHSQSAGTLTLPTGTSTIADSFVTIGGTVVANSGLLYLTGPTNHMLSANGSSLSAVTFAGGDYTLTDTSATTTDSLTILSGDVTFPSGVLTVGGDVENVAGTISHNSGTLRLATSSTAILQASSSDLFTVVFAAGGSYTVADNSLSLLDSLLIVDGSDVALATTSIGGSFDAGDGTFTVGSTTVLFNSADVGETIDPGSSEFYNVRIAAPSGGYTTTANATTTNNFDLASAASFTQQSGTTLAVEGVFFNSVGGLATEWSGSTLSLTGAFAYNINDKLDSGDNYDTLIIGANADLRMWFSAATTTIVDSSSSLYSQDHNGVDGELYIYGDFHIDTVTEDWSYATDFDGADLTGFERAVTVRHAANSTTTVDGGTLNIVGISGNETTVTNQGGGTYSLAVTDGTLLAQYYALRNMNGDGLSLSGTPVISSLSYGDYELAVDGGSLITLSSTTLNANASLVITGNRFATTTAITGSNVKLTGVTSNAWTFTGHTGNLDGEDYDVDGVDACGSVRWSDSQCLITQQTAFRWRNDDGGAEAPAAEWYDANWDARQRVRIENVDATTYTDATVQLVVPYDSDMQTDYDDLRFTDSTGTNTISHWIGSTTANVMAEVWIELPTLPAEDTATVFMYYNNPTATSSSSLTDTFIAGDAFEDGNVSEYSGETADFTAGTDHVYDGTNALEASDDTGRTESGGMYRLDETIAQGETIRVKQYIDTIGNGTSPGDSTDEFCTLFGVQATSAPSDNYGVCLDLNGTDRLVLVRDAVDSADTIPGVTLDSANITVVDGWYTIEIDWSAASGGTIDVSMVNEAGTSIATLSATDSNYTSGGYGFTYWFQHGGWDGFTSRALLTNEPTYIFGVKQTDGGASWAAAENTDYTIDPESTVRLRIGVENSGLAITNQQFRLEYAPRGVAPSCEAVDSVEYATVPLQSSCSGEPVCMAASTNVTNGASTVDLLTNVSGTFTAGELREDPSNTSGNISVAQNEYTELEYVITPTLDVVDEQLCFRVTNAGTAYDTYLEVPQLTLRFDPVLDTIVLNEGQPISLLPGTTTPVFATTSVTDLNGAGDLVAATTTFYRSGVAGGASCTPDNNNCYIASGSQCEFVNCAGNTCDLECHADIFFHADPTDTGSVFEGQEWFAFVEVEDSNAGIDFDTSIGQELLTLRAIDVEGAIDYGVLTVNSDTGGANASTSVENLGNVEADIQIQGTDLTDGFSSVIPSNQQKFATSTFTYSACGASCGLLSSTTPVALDIDLTKPTTSSPFVADELYWGISIPFGINSAPHQGVNVFTPVSPL